VKRGAQQLPSIERICPSGKSICANPKEIAFVQPGREKDLSSDIRKIMFSWRIPPRHEGRMRIVTKRGAGSDGRGLHHATNDAGCGRRSRVVLAPLGWRQVREVTNLRATVTNKVMDTGESTKQR
jgi:hypothetical protein